MLVIGRNSREWAIVRHAESGRTIRVGARIRVGPDGKERVHIVFDDPEQHFDVYREEMADVWRRRSRRAAKGGGS